MATGDSGFDNVQETGGQIFLRLRELTSTELPNGIALASSKKEGRIGLPGGISATVCPTCAASLAKLRTLELPGRPRVFFVGPFPVGLGVRLAYL